MNVEIGIEAVWEKEYINGIILAVYTYSYPFYSVTSSYFASFSLT